MYIRKDLKEFVTNNLESMAEGHLEVWKDRYYRKSKSDIRFDLNMNHDPSLEIERVQEEIGRELTDNEYSWFVSKFNRMVVKLLY
jgi:hypothetical protein